MDIERLHHQRHILTRGDDALLGVVVQQRAAVGVVGRVVGAAEARCAVGHRAVARGYLEEPSGCDNTMRPAYDSQQRESV